jgi:hypothetical protein
VISDLGKYAFQFRYSTAAEAARDRIFNGPMGKHPVDPVVEQTWAIAERLAGNFADVVRVQSQVPAVNPTRQSETRLMTSKISEGVRGLTTNM